MVKRNPLIGNLNFKMLMYSIIGLYITRKGGNRHLSEIRKSRRILHGSKNVHEFKIASILKNSELVARDTLHLTIKNY